jgi:hypothetical protein
MQSEIDSEINLKQYQSEIAFLRMCCRWLSHAVAKIQLGSELEFVPSAAPRTTPFSDKGSPVRAGLRRRVAPFLRTFWKRRTGGLACNRFSLQAIRSCLGRLSICLDRKRNAKL